jgi:hypothetical protein
VPLAAALQVFSAQVLSDGSEGFGIGSGVPKLHPVSVQSGSALSTAGVVEVGPIVQLEVGQSTANRLVEPSGIGPSGTRPAPPPRLRPPQVRFLITALLAFSVLPQTPPGMLVVNSRNAPPTAVVEVVVDVVVLVVEVVGLVVEVVGLVVEVVGLVVEVVGLVVEVVGLVVEVVGLVVEVVGLVVEVVGLVVEVVGLVVEVVGLVVEVVGLVVEVVGLVVEVVGLVVEVVVVVGVQSGNPDSPVQVQVPVLHCAMTDLRHSLRALPDKPTQPAAISSEQFFLPHGGGSAVATEETKTPAPSATAANVTTTLRPIVLIVIIWSPCGRSHAKPTLPQMKGAKAAAGRSMAPWATSFQLLLSCRGPSPEPTGAFQPMRR